MNLLLKSIFLESPLALMARLLPCSPPCDALLARSDLVEWLAYLLRALKGTGARWFRRSGELKSSNSLTFPSLEQQHLSNTMPISLKFH